MKLLKCSLKKVLLSCCLAIIGIFAAALGTTLFVYDAAATVMDYVILGLFFWPSIIIASIFGAIFDRSTAATDIPMVLISIVFNGVYFYAASCLILRDKK
jgi:hypothetical protein